jgi:magnesium-transporting ATPase (P-type)
LRTDTRAYHASTTADTLVALGSAPDGLASAEAARRLKIHGLNELPAARPDPLWRLVVRQLRSAIALLLLAGIVLLAGVLSRVPIGKAEWAVILIAGAVPAVVGQTWRWRRADK